MMRGSVARMMRRSCRTTSHSLGAGNRLGLFIELHVAISLLDLFRNNLGNLLGMLKSRGAAMVT